MLFVDQVVEHFEDNFLGDVFEFVGFEVIFMSDWHVLFPLAEVQFSRGWGECLTILGHLEQIEGFHSPLA